MISDKNYNKTKQNLESFHVNILYPFFLTNMKHRGSININVLLFYSLMPIFLKKNLHKCL